MMTLRGFGTRLACALLSVSIPVGLEATTRDGFSADHTQAHERLVPLQGGQNFRDLGGYQTADGRTVKWGVVYRSGSMARLTSGDFETLSKRGIRTVIDLRSGEERRKEPVNWPVGLKPNILARDYSLQSGELFRVLAAPGVTVSQARVAFRAFYADLPFQLAGQYRGLFAELLARKTPLIVNCSAGKDRSGVAAALVLTALGVPRRTIMRDYLLSNQAFHPDRTLAADPKQDGQWRRLTPAVTRVMMSVDATYLDAAFASIERRPGGMTRYIHDDLNLTSQDLAKLKILYLE